MLLGVGADMKTTHREQEFLPENLLYDFDHATVLGHDGGRRQLVMKRRMALEGGVQVVEPDFLLSPTEISFMILVVIVLLTVGEFKRHRTYKYVDVVLMTFYGLVGCLLTVMLFSQHPTTSTNLQWVLINPVHLWYIPAVFKRRSSRYWWLVLSMLVVYFVLATVQQYPEGMLILALCLLLRVWSNLKNEK
jgi:Ca2+/Na+ antiporter